MGWKEKKEKRLENQTIFKRTLEKAKWGGMWEKNLPVLIQVGKGQAKPTQWGKCMHDDCLTEELIKAHLNLFPTEENCARHGGKN